MEFWFYNILERDLSEWHSYDAFLQIEIIQSDVTLYAKQKKNIDIYREGFITQNDIRKLNALLTDSQNNSTKDVKVRYEGYIHKLSTPDKESSKFVSFHNDDSEYSNHSDRNEFEIVSKIENEMLENEKKNEWLNEANDKLEEIRTQSNLSEIEEIALEYIKSKRIEKHPLLELFTLQGIIQIANRAAYKLLYKKKIIAS